MVLFLFMAWGVCLYFNSREYLLIVILGSQSAFQIKEL